jgi:cold shock CspA family protein
MAKGFFIRGFGFIEDNDKNKDLLIAKGLIPSDKPKRKKKQDDTVEAGNGESDSSDAERIEE